MSEGAERRNINGGRCSERSARVAVVPECGFASARIHMAAPLRGCQSRRATPHSVRTPMGAIADAEWRSGSRFYFLPNRLVRRCPALVRRLCSARWMILTKAGMKGRPLRWPKAPRVWLVRQYQVVAGGSMSWDAVGRVQFELAPSVVESWKVSAMQMALT